jgi:hypothetical protein
MHHSARHRMKMGWFAMPGLLFSLQEKRSKKEGCERYFSVWFVLSPPTMAAYYCTMQADSISIFEAINQMRHLSSMGVPFSFSHATYDFQRRCSHGVRHVTRALLRPAASGDNVIFADHKLFYYDQDEKPRNCWQILIMYFNGKKVYL